MVLSSLRPALEYWLIGKPISQLSTPRDNISRLPRILNLLQLLQFYHLSEGQPLLESYKMSFDAVICIWMRASIPTQQLNHVSENCQSCIRMLLLLRYTEHNNKKTTG